MPSLNVYEIVTERVLEGLKAGIIPWEKPWQNNHDLPRNGHTGKYYRGMNVFLLSLTCAARGYDAGIFVTYNQAKQMGGQVRKGEKSTPVVFWKIGKYAKENSAGESEERKSFLLRYYNVFHISQCDGLKLPKRVQAVLEAPAPTPAQTLDAAQRIVDAWQSKPVIRHGSDVAAYAPKTDVVHMPKVSQFKSGEHYHSTLFHELVHSTGAEKRLNRPGITDSISFGSDKYAKEELIAEMGAAFLCAEAGIDNLSTQRSTVAYIQNWIKKFEEDSKVLLQAAGAAQAAVDTIIGKREEEEADEELAMTA